ncbi:formin-like protein 9 [Alnus glutinosa]|uniref:formin-like protein 9 n=1 Tax=Alnus glutinosa TaxID=3517 RepID=UPI002D78CCEE|nr:formin-like protein 9 [Alnus glutinosa]
MSCFPAKVMATLVALFLLVGGIDIQPTSASLPYGGRKSFSLDRSTKTTPRLEGSSESLNNIITSKKIVFARILRGRGPSPPPPPTRNRPIKLKPPSRRKPPPAPPILN